MENHRPENIDRIGREEDPARPVRILVIEDSPDDATLLEILLRRAGFEVDCAGDGCQGLARVQAGHPDLILLDFIMPCLDGVEVCRRLKSGFDTMNIPIIMISGQEQPEAIVRAFESGADDYVVKPFDLPTLLARIRANLRRTVREISTNPLTHIPGINFLHSRFPGLAAGNGPIALAICDIDNFKAFNDRYGFDAGDRVIRALADILRQRILPHGAERTILVHVGGDDFIFVCHPDAADEICRQVIHDFDHVGPGFYDAEDRERGYIQAVNRRGMVEIFPLMTLSIGVAASDASAAVKLAELSQSANEVKNYLKKQTLSTYMVNRRRG